MSYFRQFPKIGYDLKNDGVIQNVVNIYRSIRPLQQYIDNISAYKYYEIKNGERPDIVSQRLYGTPNYYWTFFIINDYLHYGLASWPMSSEDLYEWIKEEYNGFAITTNTIIRRNTDQLITDHENSLSGRFQIGEKINGGSSSANGTLKKKLIDMNQLIVQNCTGTFIGDPTLINNPSETIVGETSGDSVTSYQVYKYEDAPYQYYLETDITYQRVVDNGIFINGGTPASDLAFISNRAHVEQANMERSNLRVIDPNYIRQFTDKFETLING
jgi:hypothetical protein